MGELKDFVALLSLENQNQTQLSASLEKDLEKLVKTKKEMEDQSVTQSAAYEERRTAISELESQLDEILRDQEYAKERLVLQKTERVRLELAQKKLLQEVRIALRKVWRGARSLP